MPFNKPIQKINQGAQADYGGGLFQIVAIGTATPDSTNTETIGYVRGALLINTSGTTTANTIYVNTGTVSSATWTALTIS